MNKNEFIAFKEAQLAKVVGVWSQDKILKQQGYIVGLKMLSDAQVQPYIDAHIKKQDEMEAYRKISRELLDFAAKNETLGYLKGRWLDEREYEDFAEYKKAIAKIFESVGYVVKNVTKGFAITLEKNSVKCVLKYNATSLTVNVA